ncbi:MAG: hypothetical protein DRI61_16415 [Chloroflexi bacterium]|nr:MAG: hypothetical protein DRI61_16415 [Chloroflexota bacterium]
MHVFVDRALSEEVKTNIASDAVRFFQLSNEIEIEEYRQERPDFWERYTADVEKELGVVLSSQERRKIRETVGMYVRGQRQERLGIPSYDEFKSVVKSVKKVGK